MQQPAMDFRQNLIQKIAKWKAGLADLGKQNPLINFNQDSLQALEIITESVDILYQNLIFAKKTLNFQMLDSEHQDIKALPDEKNTLELITRQTGVEQLKCLKKLYSQAQLSFEKQGINNLFLALGTLTWHDKDEPEEPLITPIILVPVELIKEARRDVYRISVLEENIVFNSALVQNLKQTFGIRLPEAGNIQELSYSEIISQISELLVELKTWQIKDDVFLCLFPYAKAIIAQDINENENRILSNPILQAISGDLANYQASFKEHPDVRALDSLVKPEQIFQVLDADSSQQVVIEAAKQGSSFVIQAPPGTGKSQTIVNLIAELVSAGKSVLLVAEKERALSVVYQRMVECGLDDICLNFHRNTTTDIQKLIHNLDKTIEDISQISGFQKHNLLLENLYSIRQSLNLYHTSLHTKEKPLDKSVFEIFGFLLKKEREKIPDIEVMVSNWSQWNCLRLEDAKHLLNQLSKFLPFVHGEKTTLWAKSSLATYSNNLELEIKERIQKFQRAIILSQNISRELERKLKIQPLSNLESLDICYAALYHLVKAPLELPENWVEVDISTAREALNTLEKDIQEMERKKLSSEAENLLSQLSSFIFLLKREKTIIWERSNLKYCSDTREIEINNKIAEFQQALSLIQTASQQLKEMLNIQPLLNLKDVEICDISLQHILKAPLQLPDNWVKLNISTVQNAFNCLRNDIREIERVKPSLEAESLLNQLSSFLPFLRREITTIWQNSQLQSCSEDLEVEINHHIDWFQKSISSLQATSQKLQNLLINQPLSNLEDIEICLPALNHIINSPSELPKDWNIVDISTAQGALAKLKADVTFLENNEPLLKHKYHQELFSSELSALNNRFQRYSRYWIVRIFNGKYREDFKRIKKLRIEAEKISFEELKQDLLQAVEIQAARNELYNNDYPARETFGSLFNPEISSCSELIYIEQAINWLIQLQDYSLSQDAVRNLINSQLLRRELAKVVKKLKSFPEDFQQGMDLLTLYFNENDIFGQYIPTNQILFTDLIKFLNQAKTDLPHFRNWLTYKQIYTELQNQGLQEFVDALRDNTPSPIIPLQNKLSQTDYFPSQVFGSLFNPQISSQLELKEIEAAINWLVDLQQYSLDTDSVQQIINSPSLRHQLAELLENIQTFSEKFRKGMIFVLMYFKENDIAGQYLPHSQILFSDLINFLNQAKTDLPDFRSWLIYKQIHTELESLGLQEFVNALRDNLPNPVEAIKNKLNQTDYLPSQIFGSLFNPQISSQVELIPIQEAFNWLVDLQQYSLNKNSVQQLINSSQERQEFSALIANFESTYKNIRQGFDILLSYFNESDITESSLPHSKIPFVELDNFLNIAKSELSDFPEWLNYKEICEKLEHLGAKKFLEALRTHRLEPIQWYPCLEKIIYKTCLDAILAQKPELNNFNVEIHERQIQQFSQLDISQLETARERLKQLYVQRWQNHQKNLDIQSELRILKREVTKEKQHLSLRKLLNDKQKGAPNLVKALKPCWMMSPLSVSQYIDASTTPNFDVLIIDEASQLCIENVVGSIIRADQVIVIGDNNTEENTSDESILDECSNFMFEHTLKWHDYSQDERLIAFSNKHFYDSQLITFPTPVQNPDLGVCFKHVPDGIYDQGGSFDNKREAEVVAQLALEHFQNFPDESLGIIAFSSSQANAIQEQIQILGRDNVEFEIFCSENSPQFFIKPLENLQTDERDVIILSVGYARDNEGQLNLDFDSIIKQDGGRLNLAITRAKRKLTLVSSLLASDIDITGAKNPGIKLLHDYLEYAAKDNIYSHELKFKSPLEEDIYHTLVELGYTIRTQIGCSDYKIDLAVVNKNNPKELLLGIECDGASYHNSPTARDRHRLRQQALEKLGWNIHRIWSTEWFHNKPAQLRLLIEKIERLEN
jgi:very-short-patch-repair endonuclease